MSLSAPIVLDFSAEIYAWHAVRVVNLFNPGFSRDAIEYEANLTCIVRATGLRVPAVGDILEIYSRFGLEYERVEGISMLQALLKKPWKFSIHARQLAVLQADIHQYRVPEMPSLRERLSPMTNRAGKLPENVRQAALKALESLPEDERLCHGDFHPNNFLLSSRGPVIIDWIDATCGFPLADVTRSTLLIDGGPIPPGTPGAWLIKKFGTGSSLPI